MSVSHFFVPPGPNYLPPPQRFVYADWNAGGPIRSGRILLNPDDKTGDVERMSQQLSTPGCAFWKSAVAKLTFKFRVMLNRGRVAGGLLP
jgi:hypothetical protein